jgi:hypothetical protein
MYISRGIEHIEKAIQLSDIANVKCLSKTLGDLCSFCRFLSPYDLKQIDSTGSAADNISTAFDALLHILKKAGIAYKKMYDLLPNDPDTCFDLGSIYYFQATCVLLSRGQGSGVVPTSFLIDDEVKNLYKYGIEYFSRGVQIDPNHSGCWNGIGACVLDDKVI